MRCVSFAIKEAGCSLLSLEHHRCAWQDHDLQDALGPESKGAGDHVISMKGVGTFRVADGHDSAEEQRRLLARRTLAEVPSLAHASNSAA